MSTSATKQNASNAIAIAAALNCSNSSAQSCLQDAMACLDDSNYESAIMWALKAACYEVGMFNIAYNKIKNLAV